MSYLKVNKKVWDAVPASCREHITTHLQQCGVLGAGQIIVPDAETLPPELCMSMNKKADKRVENVEALGMDWLCKAICHSAETSYMCPLADKGLSLCLTKVTESRVNFYLHFDSPTSAIQR